MSRVLRGRTVAYDNVIGSTGLGVAIQRERLILGSTPSTEIIGGGTGCSSAVAGAGSLNHSNIMVATGYPTSQVVDNILSGSATPAGEDVVSTS